MPKTTNPKPFVAEILPNGNLEIRPRGSYVPTVSTSPVPATMFIMLFGKLEQPADVDLFNVFDHPKDLNHPRLRIADAIEQDPVFRWWNPAPDARVWELPLDQHDIDRILQKNKKLTLIPVAR